MSKTRQAGFTIVELMLALSLLGFIMIFAMTVLAQLVTTYNKGLTLSQINQTTRQLDNDVAKGLRFSAPGTFKVWRLKRISESEVQEVSTWDEATAGVFCASNVAYLWNLGASSSGPDSMPVFTYDANKPLRMVRVGGDNAATGPYCKPPTNQTSPSDVMSTRIDPSSKSVTELLGTQSMVLAARVEEVGAVDNVSTPDLGGSGASNPDNSITVTVGRVAHVYFALSTAGQFQASFQGEGAARHLTCESSQKPDAYCSFGEFNAIVYMRGK